MASPLNQCPVCQQQISLEKALCENCGIPILPSSILAYERPRDIAGNYTVSLTLRLSSTETATVTVKRNRPDQGEEEKSTFSSEGSTAIVRCLIPRCIIGDEIIVEVHDKEVVPFQITVFTATKQNITAQPKPCTIYGQDWEIIFFNPIGLLDLNEIFEMLSKSVIGKSVIAKPEEVSKLVTIHVLLCAACGLCKPGPDYTSHLDQSLKQAVYEFLNAYRLHVSDNISLLGEKVYEESIPDSLIYRAFPFLFSTPHQSDANTDETA